jgi:membrane protein YqaA with SNARE-associated domain
MKDLLAWAQAWAIALGGPGLLIVALVDASVLTLPEIVDVLVIVMTMQAPSWLWLYVVSATVGSTLGSMGVHYVGRKGGEAFLKRRVSDAQAEKVLAQFRRWGFVAILVPAMLPPPTPFKLLCIGAGATGMPASSFALATGIGRGLRYAGLGIAAYWYGHAALDYLDRNGTAVGWWLLALFVIGGGLYYWRHQRQRAAI